MIRHTYVDNTLTVYDVAGLRSVKGKHYVVLTNHGTWYTIECIKKKGVYYVPARGAVTRLEGRPQYIKIKYTIQNTEVVQSIRTSLVAIPLRD